MKYVKVSLFITILGLFFIGTPQFNSKANSNTISFTFQNGYSDGSQYNLDKYSNLVDLSTQGYIDMTDFSIDNTYAGDFFRFVAESIRDNTTGDYYYEFSIIDDTNSIVWRLTSGGYVSTNALGINTVLDFKLLKNTDFSRGYDQGYNQGLDDGFDDGFDEGYDEGYDSAKNEFGYNYDGIIITGNDAYLTGYQKAIQESGDTKANIINFIPGVLGAIFMFFFQIGQIGILGITIIDILGILVLISGLIFVIKFFF